MLKSSFYLCILLVAMLSSCKKTTDVEVTLSTSGKLSYKLVDDAGKGIPNIPVNLSQVVNAYTGDVLLDTRVTDQDGVADFGDLNPVVYVLSASGIKINKTVYTIREFAQVQTGKNNQKTLKVSDFSGTLGLYLQRYPDPEPLVNKGVILIPADRFSYDLPVQQLLPLAEAKGVTDVNGYCAFKISTDVEYFMIAYDLNTNTRIGSPQAGSVKRGETLNFIERIYGDY